MNASPSLIQTPKPEPLGKLLEAAIEAEPELGRLYSRRELKARLGRAIWRLKISGQVTVNHDLP